MYYKYFLFSQDSLTIFDGAQMVAEETGDIMESVIRSSQSDMTIHFQSDHIGTRKGFEIKINFFLPGMCITE